MTDIPIIYSGAMVRALLEDRKTMTRRLAWRMDLKAAAKIGSRENEESDGELYADLPLVKPSPWQKVKPGDRLWVRENFALVGGGDPGLPIYAANWREDAKARGLENLPAETPKWTPCIHMPRWASRLTLVVTATKIERLQDISREDATAEGIGWSEATLGWSYEPADGGPGYHSCDPRRSFEVLFCMLHGDRVWFDNPEVVALIFTVHKANIDALKAGVID